MKLVEPERPHRPCPSTVGSAPILLDELGDDFLDDMPADALPLDEVDSETFEAATALHELESDPSPPITPDQPEARSAEGSS
jgi:hypothetical protein